MWTAVMVVSVMIVAAAPGMMAYADSHTLVDVRAGIIASGTIPDTYLIEPTGTYWDDNGGSELKSSVQQWISWKGTATASDRFQNSVNRALYNVEVLLEGPADRMHEVTALVVAKERLQGSYSETGYLKKYHDYIIAEYSQPSTITGIDAQLNSTLGSMLSLAGAIKAVTDKAASISGVPDGLWTADPEYWFTVKQDTYCELEPSCNTGVIPLSDGLAASAQSSGTRIAWSWSVPTCLHGICQDSMVFTPISSSRTWDFNEGLVSGTGVYGIVSMENSPAGSSVRLEFDMRGTGEGNYKPKTDEGSGTVGTWGWWYGWNPSALHPCFSDPNEYNNTDQTVRECMGKYKWEVDGSLKVVVGSTGTGGGNTGGGNTGGGNTGSTNDPPTIDITDGSLFAKRWIAMTQEENHTIDASGSEDPDGDDTALTFDWEYEGNHNDDNTDYDLDVSGETGSSITFQPPSKLDILDFKLTVTDEDGESAEKEFSVVVNTSPYIQTKQLTTITMAQYLGLFFVDPVTKRAPYMHISAGDVDGQHLRMYVSELPNKEKLAVVSCDMSPGFLHIYDTVYDEMNRDIIADTSPIGANICMVAIEPVENGKFRVAVTDSTYHPDLEITYTIKPVTDNIALVIKDAIEIVPNIIDAITDFFCGCPDADVDEQENQEEDLVVKFAELVVDLGEEVFGDPAGVLVNVWRCEQGHTLENTDCDPGSVIESVTVPLLGGAVPAMAIGSVDNGWEVLAADTDTGTIMKDDVAYVSSQTSSGSSIQRAQSITFVGNNLTRTLHDFGIEPGKTYHYAMRVIVNGTTSSLIPLGSIETPADTTAPRIALQGETDMTITLGTPYVEPGYAAVDDYDLVLTENVTVTGIVNHTAPGKYYVFYDVTDSSGNAAERQHRSVTVPGSNNYTVDSPPPASANVYRIMLHGEQDDEAYQGHLPDVRATCSINGTSQTAVQQFTGDNQPTGLSFSGDDEILRYYSTIGEYTMDYTCRGQYDEITLQRTLNVLDAPPWFDWGGYPTLVLCFDEGNDVVFVNPVNGTYTCTDSAGQTITATGPPE